MAKWNKYVKRPIEIEAILFDGNNRNEIANRGENIHWGCDLDGEYIMISTLEGDMKAIPGDWIICGIQGEFYPCKPDIFKETYELY